MKQILTFYRLNETEQQSLLEDDEQSAQIAALQSECEGLKEQLHNALAELKALREELTTVKAERDALLKQKVDSSKQEADNAFAELKALFEEELSAVKDKSNAPLKREADSKPKQTTGTSPKTKNPMHDNYEELDNIITLNDEYGNEIQFEFLDLLEYNSEEYVVLLPTNSEEEGQVVILKLEETDDNTETYIGVKDEDTLDAVFQIFKEKFKDEFNFEE